MSKLNHLYFGLLDTDALKKVDVIWEQSFFLNDAAFDISLWAGDDPGAPLDAPMLDAFAKLLQNLPALDIYARQQLEKMLAQDKSYIEFHAEELAEDSETISKLLAEVDGGEISIQIFAAAMRLTNIGLWLDVPNAPIIMDYMIDPENSDEILAVKLTAEGQLVSIDWES
ncbi:MAG: DUF2004 domain-containing protein [Rhodocyclaceae bacterium]